MIELGGLRTNGGVRRDRVRGRERNQPHKEERALEFISSEVSLSQRYRFVKGLDLIGRVSLSQCIGPGCTARYGYDGSHGPSL